MMDFLTYGILKIVDFLLYTDIADYICNPSAWEAKTGDHCELRHEWAPW